MVTKYFKCRLLSDVVFNSSLATEGNMESLDYIPGSNFLGVVAKDYEEFGEDAYDIFHSGKVSFGDALISVNENVSYAMPFSLFTEKLKNDITKEKVWVHHKIVQLEPPKDNNENKFQLKQQRSGFFNKNKDYIKKVQKEFALKSAYDSKERRSKEGKMFGFDALKKGQEFVFSVVFEDEKYVDIVTKKLTDNIVNIGKSKTAQYGLTDIETIDQPGVFESRNQFKDNLLVIYAESNLAFVNEYGQSTFHPNTKDFGLTLGEIKWEYSQIRTYSYSPWNEQRKATATQRDVILKGSVIVIELDNPFELDVNLLPRQVGEYNAEGLGRVIYNPEFLDYQENGEWILYEQLKEFSKKKDKQKEKVSLASPLAKLLDDKRKESNNDLAIGGAVIEALTSRDYSILRDSKITNSQWGNIRKTASLATDIVEVKEKLFADKTGYLVHGFAAERIWDKQKGKRRKTLEKLIDSYSRLGSKFIAKFASEISKINSIKK